METIGNNITMYNGDVLATLMGMPDNSVDAVLTDPPYCSGGMNTAALLIQQGFFCPMM